MNECNGNYKNYNQTALLDIAKDDEQFSYEEVKENGVRLRGKIEPYKFVYNTGKSSRRIPNILKNNSRLQKTSKNDETKTNYAVDNTENTEWEVRGSSPIKILYEQVLTDIVYVKDKHKSKQMAHSRKQNLNFINVCKKSTCFFCDKGNKILNYKFLSSVNIKSSKKNKLKHNVKRNNKKKKVSIIKEKEESGLLPSKSEDISLHFGAKYEAPSSLLEMEVDNSIDFSSNTIFKEINHEFYRNNSWDYISWSSMNSNKPFSYFDMEDWNLCIKEFDIKDENNNYNIDTGRFSNKALTKSVQRDVHVNDKLLSESCNDDSHSDLQEFFMGEKNKDNYEIFDMSEKLNNLYEIETSNIEEESEGNVNFEITMSQQVQKFKGTCKISCKYCNKLFKWKYSLKRHMKSCQYLEMSMKCHICFKTYRYTASLKRHLEKHHKSNL